jgi:hypothetical protein
MMSIVHSYYIDNLLVVIISKVVHSIIGPDPVDGRQYLFLLADTKAEEVHEVSPRNE